MFLTPARDGNAASSAIDTPDSLQPWPTNESDASSTFSHATSSVAGSEDSHLKPTMLAAVERHLQGQTKEGAEQSLGRASLSIADAVDGDGSHSSRMRSLEMPDIENTTMHKPRRKFAPEPIETTIRSGKAQETADATSPTQPKRKFAPEPVEKTQRSSKEKPDKDSKPRRKFAAEPMETTTKSSKDKSEKVDAVKKDDKPRRRFAPEPVENSSRSSKDKDTSTEKTTKLRRKFAVEPVETSAGSSKERKKSDAGRPTPARSDSDPMSMSRSSSGSTSRKFAPELVETARGSFRKHQNPPSAIPNRLMAKLADELEKESEEAATESRFSAAALAKRARADFRRHSYTVPDLPPIESDSSGEESEASLPPSMTDSPPEDDATRRKQKVLVHIHKHRQVVRNYIHAAKMSRGLGMGLVDDKTLREQALQAFIAETAHVSVSHFAAEDEDAESSSYSSHAGKLQLEKGANPQLFRRMSHEDFHLVTEDMRTAHQEQLESAKRELEEDTAGASRFSAAALAARHHLGIHHPAAAAQAAHAHNQARADEHERRQHAQDEEFKKMRAAASPPMAGDDLNFPFSVSPKMTRCDVDQIPRPRRANSDSDEGEQDIGEEALWSARITVRADASAGLWGGMCQKNDGNVRSRPSTPLRSGLQTPMYDPSTPARRGARTPGRRPEPWTGMSFLPMTPPRSVDGAGVQSYFQTQPQQDPFTSHIDQKLKLEQAIAEEFPNRVITQIYNYLSLGYPPLARPFDEELSKISRIPIADLRRGDRSDSGNVKGYIGTPEGEGDGVEDELDGGVRCKRWEALRLYVFEWARQSPGFVQESAAGAGMWGADAPVRKGSWAH